MRGGPGEPRCSPRDVVLAGGGTGGHIEPCSPSPTPCAAARTPDVRDHLPGHRARPGDPAGARPRLRPAADPAGAAAAQAHRRPAARARPGAPRGRRRPARCSTELRRRRRRRLRRLRGAAGLPGRPAARLPIVVHEANALPGLANRIGARLAARVAVTVPGTRCTRGEHVGMPLRRRSAALDRAARRAEARARVRAGRRPARRCWSSAARRARARSTGRPSAPPTR